MTAHRPPAARHAALMPRRPCAAVSVNRGPRQLSPGGWRRVQSRRRRGLPGTAARTGPPWTRAPWQPWGGCPPSSTSTARQTRGSCAATGSASCWRSPAGRLARSPAPPALDHSPSPLPASRGRLHAVLKSGWRRRNHVCTPPAERVHGPTSHSQVPHGRCPTCCHVTAEPLKVAACLCGVAGAAVRHQSVHGVPGRASWRGGGGGGAGGRGGERPRGGGAPVLRLGAGGRAAAGLPHGAGAVHAAGGERGLRLPGQHLGG